MNLQTKLSSLSGVGPKTSARLEKLGLVTVHDLLFYFPRRYEDYTQISKISDLGRNEEQGTRNESGGFFTIRVTLLGIANKKTRRRGFAVTEAQVVDETGSLKVVWFNQSFLERMLKVGNEITLYGRVVFDSFAGGYVMESPVRVGRQKIAPVYSETEGISSFFIAKLFDKARGAIDEIEEWLPSQLLGDSLITIREAILNIHEPRGRNQLKLAQQRLAYDELFLIALRTNLAKEKLKKRLSISIPSDIGEVKSFIDALPFTLTDDQKKAVWAILRDLEKETPMNRLLNGDVGSGKTVVAAIAALEVVKSGQKVVMMVPTSILASQHYKTFCELFQNDDQVTVGLITADRQEENKEARLKNKGEKRLSSESLVLNSNIIVGTHALIQPGIKFENVGLVVVDEQHRFGVRQREALAQIGQEKNIFPHFLSMTATPIPRTLQLALFGDLDFSVIKEKPVDRKEIKTRFVEPHNRGKAYEFVRKHVVAGRQVFVICPLIEERGVKGEQLAEFDFDERKTVKDEAEKLAGIFPEFKIATLHGRMKAAEKDGVMADFSANRVQILVSTSVVEVGVDIPNASVMIIEDAERFGLAQIHQFRGRVGRGEHQSFCFLFSSSNSDKAMTRLKSLEIISDGFALSQVDLETRGPGAVFGTEQSGLLDLVMADFSDTILLERASADAKTIAPEIDKYPRLLERVDRELGIRN